jgi:hypothetical protein
MPAPNRGHGTQDVEAAAVDGLPKEGLMSRAFAVASVGIVVIVLGIADRPPPLFAPALGSPIAVGERPESLAVGDVNNDGKPDLVVCSKGVVAILLGDGTGRFQPAPGGPLNYGATELALGDVNGDGRLDLVLAHHDSYAVAVLLGDGRGGFAPAFGSPFAAKDGQHPHTHGLALADVNRDGRLDVITANNDDNDIAVLLGDGRGGFRPTPGSPFPVGPSPYPFAVGDVNGDSAPDLVVPNSGPKNRTVTVLLGDSHGRFAPAPDSPFTVPNGPYHTALGDVNGDGKLDVVAAHDDSSFVSVLLGDGRGGFSPAPGVPFDVGRRAGAVVVSNVNGDGHPDLVVAAGEDVRVLLGDGRGRFRAAPDSPYTSGKGTWRLVVADLNGDGKPDIAAPNFEGNSVTILLRR